MGDNTVMTQESLDIKRKDRRFDPISRANYSTPPDRVIRNNYNRIFDGLMNDLNSALKIKTNAPNIANALQKLNDAVNLWLEFNDYISVPCYCIKMPTIQNILIRPTPRQISRSLGGKRRKTRKSKQRKTKRNSRTTKKKIQKKNSVGKYRK
jgi:hypothetical protein